MDTRTRSKVRALVRFQSLQKRAGVANVVSVGILPEERAPLVPRPPTEALPSDVVAVVDLLKSSPLNLLLMTLPVAFLSATGNLGGLGSATVTFITSFLGLIPLALLLSSITEDLAVRFGDVIGGLLSATFGNVVELIIALAALREGLFVVVSSSLLGSILGNLLLVLGASFFAGGIAHHQQRFSVSALRVYGSLLLLACVGFGVPTAYAQVQQAGPFPTPSQDRPELVRMSRVVAGNLLGAYLAYMYFQLYSHANLFESEEAQALAIAATGLVDTAPAAAPGPTSPPAIVVDTVQMTSHTAGTGIAPPSAVQTSPEGSDPEATQSSEVEGPAFSFSAALTILLGITLLVAAASECLVKSVEAFATRVGIQPAFIGLILIPIAGNVAEHVTAVIVATKGKLDLSLAVALGSSIQIALFVVPVVVLAGVFFNQPFTLAFDPFSTIVVILAVLHTNVSLDGSSNWLLGFMLITAYNCIATAFLFGNFPAN